MDDDFTSVKTLAGTGIADQSAVIDHTKKWLSSVIIGHGFCPFAKREFDLNRIHYAAIEAEDLETQLEQVILHCGALDQDKDRATSLLIFPTALSDFTAYLDLLDLATELLKLEGYECIYQLASFHPEYIFADVPADDPSHYTNRSPYPMLHILREASVEAVLKTYPDPENIPQRNIELTQSLGLDAMRNLLKACTE